MEELFQFEDFVSNRSLCEDVEDFDSGYECSSVPSSPSNLSDFSGSSLDEFADDFTIRSKDIIEMGKSVLDGGPVLNPFIKIIMDDETEALPGNSSDFLNILDSSEGLFDSECFDIEKQSQLPAVFEFEEHPVLSDIVEEETMEDINNVEVKEQSPRKRRSNRISPAPQDHTYAARREKPHVVKEILPAAMPTSKSNSKKVIVTKDSKYLEKRRKNNMAAQRSRELKRNREIENLKKCEKLSKENSNLLKELRKLQSVVDKLETKLNML